MSRPKLRISLNWQICVFALLLFPLLLRLGFWQLQRAEEKRTIQQYVDQQQALPTQSVEKTLSTIEQLDSVLYRRVQSGGVFEQDHFWLVENRTYRGRNGFHVVAPLYIAAGQTILVNLGWIAGTGYRENLPTVSLPKGRVNITGQLVKPSINQLLLGEKRTEASWPKLILQIDLDNMSKELGKELEPVVLQIEAENPNALQVNWVLLNTPVSKHLGYAYQWFAMAFALAVLTLFTNTNLGLWLRPKKRNYERK